MVQNKKFVRRSEVTAAAAACRPLRGFVCAGSLGDHGKRYVDKHARTRGPVQSKKQSSPLAPRGLYIQILSPLAVHRIGATLTVCLCERVCVECACVTL